MGEQEEIDKVGNAVSESWYAIGKLWEKALDEDNIEIIRSLALQLRAVASGGTTVELNDCEVVQERDGKVVMMGGDVLCVAPEDAPLGGCELLVTIIPETSNG